MWPIIPSSFSPTPWVKNHKLDVCKTLCDSSTHFAYFNSWQKVDGETSIVNFGHHSTAYLEGLTKFLGFWGSLAPPYSPFCAFKSHTFGPKPLVNPRWVKPTSQVCQLFASSWHANRGLQVVGDLFLLIGKVSNSWGQSLSTFHFTPNCRCLWKVQMVRLHF